MVAIDAPVQPSTSTSEALPPATDGGQPFISASRGSLPDGEAGGYHFNKNPLDPNLSKSYPDFATLTSAVAAATKSLGLSLRLYDPRAAGGDWQLYFNDTEVAAVGKDITLIERNETLTPQGADNWVKEAAQNPTNPTIYRADVPTATCIITNGQSTLDLTCGNAPNVTVSFLMPAVASKAQYDAGVASLQKLATAVMAKYVQL